MNLPDGSTKLTTGKSDGEVRTNSILRREQWHARIEGYLNNLFESSEYDVDFAMIHLPALSHEIFAIATKVDTAKELTLLELTEIMKRSRDFCFAVTKYRIESQASERRFLRNQ